MADQPTTKGTILRSLLKFVDKDLTPEQLARAIGSLPPEDQSIVSQHSILPTARISEFTLNRLTVAAAKVKGEDLNHFGRRAGRAELADAIGVYRFLTNLLTPKAILGKASSTWSTVHSHGEMLVENVTSSSARIRLKHYPSEEAHCARLTGWFEGLGEMTGAKDLRVVHDHCITKGAPDCEWQIEWR